MVASPVMTAAWVTGVPWEVGWGEEERRCGQAPAPLTALENRGWKGSWALCGFPLWFILLGTGCGKGNCREPFLSLLSLIQTLPAIAVCLQWMQETTPPGFILWFPLFFWICRMKCVVWLFTQQIIHKSGHLHRTAHAAPPQGSHCSCGSSTTQPTVPPQSPFSSSSGTHTAPPQGLGFLRKERWNIMVVC